MDSFESGHRHHRARKQAGTEVSLGGQEKTQEGGDCWSSCSVSGALICGPPQVCLARRPAGKDSWKQQADACMGGGKKEQSFAL